MSVNLSEQNRRELLRKVQTVREYIAGTGDSEEANCCLSCLDELEQYVARYKFGLVFEEHQEKIQQKLLTQKPYLTEEKALRISRGGSEHMLIEGDNLAALTLLLETHRGKIDLCMIDPPYNRGKTDFLYDDDYVDAGDRFLHSKWASFMYSRLMPARELLAEDGYIFINIDENEFATLKMICDEIFGGQNFVAVYMWEKTSTAPALSKKVRKKLEYILCYAKKLDTTHQFSQGEIEGKDAPLLNRVNEVHALHFPPGTVHFGVPDGTYLPAKDGSDDGRKIRLLAPLVVRDGRNASDLFAEGRYKWVQETLDKEVKKGTYFLIKSHRFSIRYQRVGKKRLKTPQNLLHAGMGVGTNEEAKKELRALGLSAFDYPKPTSLYMFLIDMINRGRDITVLDFFAGSGTTGHAVMKKNREDGGTRRFILCTDNQGNICRDITYERLSRAIEQEGYLESLVYMKIEYGDR